MEINEVCKDIYTAKLQFFLGESSKRMERHVHIGLIDSEIKCLIDTGAANNFEDIKKFCASLGADIGDISLIINTHCHPDHIGSNFLLKKMNPEIMVCAHPLAAPYIEDIKRQCKVRPVPGFNRLVAGSTKVDRVLEEGETVDVGMKLKIIHTPGHSPGSISIFIPEQSVLFTGDAIPGIKDIPIYEDVELVRKSFTKIETTEAERVVSSFDGKSGDVKDVVNKGRIFLERVDEYLKDFIIKVKKGNKNNIDIKEATSYVLNALGFKELKPPGIVGASIKSHLSSSTFNNKVKNCTEM